MDRFKQMKREAEEMVSKAETLQQMVAKFMDEASETLKANIAEGEEYLNGLQRLGESSGGAQGNQLLKTLVQLMREDLLWFRQEETRLTKVRGHYAEIAQLYS